MGPDLSPRGDVAPTRRLLATVALGATLARRGPMAAVSLAISGVTALGATIVAVTLARRGGDAPVHEVPVLASSALAWGGGFLHAVAVSVNALRRDRTEGIERLVRARSVDGRAYLIGRVGGLACLLAVVLGGGTLLTGVAAILTSASGSAIGRTAQATVASVIYSVAFAVVLAPIVMALLGARTRLFGYFGLLAVLWLPELVVGKLAVPSEIAELCSLPSALAALRASLAPGTADALRFARALVALALVAGVALFFLRREVAVLSVEKDAS